MTTTADTAAMAIAWTERARAALAEAAGYRAQAEAFIDREDPIADTHHADMRREGYRHLIAVADGLESYADQCREAAHSCRDAAQARRRSRYDTSFAQLHANGTCRSPLCCGASA